jgi:hypothetical protein
MRTNIVLDLEMIVQIRNIMLEDETEDIDIELDLIVSERTRNNQNHHPQATHRF